MKPEDNNISNLNDEKPELPFSTNSDYFSDFRARLNSRLKIVSEIEAEAPLLTSIPKYNPFDVPAGYFEDLALKIQLALPSAEATVPWWKVLFRIRVWAPVATVLIVAFALIRNISPEAQETATMSTDEQLMLIDESLLVEALASDQEDADADNGIEDYLLENQIDEINLNTDL